MLSTMISLLVTLASPAAASSNELSFEVGWIGANDPAWDLFSSGDSLASVGLRGGFAVHPNVAIIAGWQHATNGATVYFNGAGEEDDDYYDESGSFRAALYTDQITVGSKADVKVFKWLHPYVTAQVVGMRGLARLDDDSNDDENLTQVQRAGLTGGFLAGGGLDFIIRVRGQVAIAPYVELGYGWLAPMVLPDLGSVQFSGFAGRTGVGVRF
ncbi:MAG: hypothetical protein Q8P18_02375 [Pseudomonadota bacterium]|nr:hypothetical protein [Pseudomonadota bacterium]